MSVTPESPSDERFCWWHSLCIKNYLLTELVQTLRSWCKTVVVSTPSSVCIISRRSSIGWKRQNIFFITGKFSIGWKDKTYSLFLESFPLAEKDKTYSLFLGSLPLAEKTKHILYFWEVFHWLKRQNTFFITEKSSIGWKRQNIFFISGKSSIGCKRQNTFFITGKSSIGWKRQNIFLNLYFWIKKIIYLWRTLTI